MKLGVESYFVRRYVSETKTKPKRPLTKRERKHLQDTCFKKCERAYISRMTQGFLSPLDSIEDLSGEAYEAFINIMDKFDKKKCGKIQKYDEEGKSKPKTLSFYFYNYFCNRVNWMACDTRNDKKKRGMTGKSSSLTGGDVSYNPVDETADLNQYKNLRSLILLREELEKQPKDVQRLFEHIYLSEERASDIRKQYEDYSKTRRLLSQFLKTFKSQNHDTLLEEVPNFKIGKVKSSGKAKK